MNILFHENQFGIRGTSVALYDYAHYNETILGNVSYIAAPANSEMDTYDKFVSRFGKERILLYEDFSDLVENVKKHYDIKAVYFIKSGFYDGKLIPGIKNIVHAVFSGDSPHGDVYVAVSKWLGDKYDIDYLPHIVSLPDVPQEYNYRNYYGISDTDIVFGRYGGFNQFDLPYLPNVIQAAADRGIKFLLMNTKVMHNKEHPNIIYLNPTYDLETKNAFINTCDAMIHGRTEGETFGLAVAEFTYMNKPVVTNIECRDRNHILMLKDKGFYYNSPEELHSILLNFQKKNYNVKHLIDEFSPEKVMSKFKQYI